MNWERSREYFLLLYISLLFLLPTALDAWINLSIGVIYFVIWGIPLVSVRESTFRLSREPTYVLAFLWLLLHLVWLFTGSHFPRASLEYSRYLLLILFALDFYEDGYLTQKLFLLLCSIGFFQALGGLYQVFLSQESMPPEWSFQGSEEVLKRAFGLFDNPNLFASFLLVLILWILGKQSSSRITALQILLLLVFVLTQSRGAFVGIAGGLGVYVLWGCGRQKLLAIGFLFLLALGFLASGREASVESQGANQRVVLFSSAINVIREHWLLGTGAGSFASEYGHYRTAGGYYALHAHNTALQIWAELGLVGIFLFLTFVLWIGLMFYRDRLFNCAPLAILTGCLFNAMFNQSFHFFDLSLLLVLALMDSCRKTPYLPPINRFKLKGMFLLLLPALMFFTLEVYKSKNWTKIHFQVLAAGHVSLSSPLNTDLKLFEQACRQSFESKTGREEVQRLINWGFFLMEKYPRESAVPFLLYKLEKDKKRKMSYLYMALELDPYSEEYFAYLIPYLKEQSRFLEIIDGVKRLLESNPGYKGINPWNDWLRFGMRESWIALGMKEKAREEFEEMTWVSERFEKRAGQLLL